MRKSSDKPSFPDTEAVTFSVKNVRPVETKSVYAFTDVDISISGIQFEILGLQARHLPGGGTSIHLPTYRDADGGWRAAINLPAELRDAIADAVLEFLVETGVAKQRREQATGP